MLDIFLIAVIALVTWSVAGDGAWGAALTLLSVIISGLLAMSLFEVTASFLQQNVSGSYEWQHRWDIIALVGLFSGFTFALRTATERILPVDIDIQGMVFDVTRWACGLLTGCVLTAFLLTALHTAPLPREFLGFTAEPGKRGGPVGQMAPDMKWLGFVHVMTESSFRKGPDGPIFDGARFPFLRGGEVKVLPSFPIRYASRRDRYFGGDPPAASSPPSTSAARGPSRAQPSASPPKF